MFTSLVRRMIEAVKEPRVGFVTEPTALLATPARRKMHEVSFEKWTEVEHAHGARAMACTLVAISKERSAAYVLVGGTADLYVIVLEAGQRAKFVDAFLDMQERGPRTLTGADLVSAKWNPPPPPPPPWYPNPDVLARLEATLHVNTLPVVTGTVDVEHRFNTTVKD